MLLGKKATQKQIYSALLNSTGVSGRTGTTVGGTYATGLAYADSKQISIVGEDPNKELVIGSKLMVV